MFNLIMLVVSIALMSGMSMMVMNYIPYTAIQTSDSRAQFIDAHKRIESGIIRYVSVEKVFDSDEDRYEITLPATGTNMESTLVGHYFFMPPTPFGMEWSFEAATHTPTGLVGIMACAYPGGALSHATKEAMIRARNRMPAGGAFVNTACGATTNDDASGDRLTLWFIPEHYLGN